MDLKAVGQRIKAAREAKNLTQEELVLFLERYYEKNLSCLNLIFPQSSEIFPSINLEN